MQVTITCPSSSDTQVLRQHPGQVKLAEASPARAGSVLRLGSGRTSRTPLRSGGSEDPGLVVSNDFPRMSWCALSALGPGSPQSRLSPQLAAELPKALGLFFTQTSPVPVSTLPRWPFTLRCPQAKEVMTSLGQEGAPHFSEVGNKGWFLL